MTEYELDYSYSDVYSDTLRRESSYLRRIAMKFAYQYIGDSFDCQNRVTELGKKVKVTNKKTALV